MTFNPHSRKRWFREFSAAINMPPEDAWQHWQRAQQFFAERKITMWYRQRTKDWCFSGFKGTGACYATLACGLGAFIDYLDAPSTLLSQLGR